MRQFLEHGLLYARPSRHVSLADSESELLTVFPECYGPMSESLDWTDS